MEEETMLYTFKQPVRGGYYYIVVKATSIEEAASTTADIIGTLKQLAGRLEHLSQFPEGTLQLGDKMQRRLDEMGYAHRFIRVYPPSYHERTERRPLLPK